MPKYLHTLIMQEVYELIVEAKDEDTAYQIARDTDLSDYKDVYGQTVSEDIEEITG